MTNDPVPGMAEAVERRRLERDLTIGQFAEAANLTRQGLDDVRNGRPKAYQDRTILGVAKALAWERDWYERIKAGQKPTPVVDLDPSARLSRVEDRLDQLERLFRRFRDELAEG